MQRQTNLLQNGVGRHRDRTSGHIAACERRVHRQLLSWATHVYRLRQQIAITQPLHSLGDRRTVVVDAGLLRCEGQLAAHLHDARLDAKRSNFPPIEDMPDPPAGPCMKPAFFE